jgi:hypothetical protein
MTFRELLAQLSNFAGYAFLVVPFVATFYFSKMLVITPKKSVAITGAILLSIVFVSISIPFYFQGYSQEFHNCSLNLGYIECPKLETSNPGWTSYIFVALPAYMITGEYGFPYLCAAVICIAIGEFSPDWRKDSALKAVFLFFAIWSSFEMYRYTVINWALE